MKYPRASAAAVILNGKVIICGGESDNNKFLNSVECFDPESGVWTEVEEMPETISYHSLFLYRDQLIILDVFVDSETGVNLIYEMNPWSGNEKWKQLPSFACPSIFFSSITLSGEVVVIGGCDPNDNDIDFNTVQIFKGKEGRHGPPLPY